MEALSKRREHTCRVFYRDGYWLFTVFEGERLVQAAGADRELPRLGDLIQASREYLDWARDDVLRNRLARMERERYDQETQDILDRIVA